VFGSSGGAVTALALVARHPTRVRTLVAHEPPVLELLPDAAEQRANTADIVETFHRDGLAAAMTKFMTNAGFAAKDQAAPVAAEPSPEQLAAGARFFAHELRWTAGYRPDITALTRGPARVVVGIGAASSSLLTYRTSLALAERLGVTTIEFPGDHGGFLTAPGEFADTLRTVLAGSAASQPFA
jgi:pimeloyl-ACP methyl ester carboxylesterase